jgi:hypothetical protein
VQVVFICLLDLHCRDFTDAQWPPARHIYRAIDFGGIRHRAAFGDRRSDVVNDDLLARADFALQAAGGNLLLRLHETMPALFFNLVWHRGSHIIGCRALHRLVFEATDTIKRGLFQPFK